MKHTPPLENMSLEETLCMFLPAWGDGRECRTWFLMTIELINEIEKRHGMRFECSLTFDPKGEIEYLEFRENNRLVFYFAPPTYGPAMYTAETIYHNFQGFRAALFHTIRL